MGIKKDFIYGIIGCMAVWGILILIASLVY